MIPIQNDDLVILFGKVLLHLVTAVNFNTCIYFFTSSYRYFERYFWNTKHRGKDSNQNFFLTTMRQRHTRQGSIYVYVCSKTVIYGDVYIQI